MLDAEGVTAPEDVPIAGDEDTVAEGLHAYERAGTTDVRVSVITSNDADTTRTRALLRTLTNA